MRVALVHDWLTGMRGGEKVLDVMCEIFPGADLFTLVHERGSVAPRIEARRIVTSALQHVPPARRRYRHFLPIFPWLIEQFDLDGYDLVVSTSHCTAKAVIPGGRARHISYCFSPMRYAWDQFDSYFGAERVGGVASRYFYGPVLRRLARWDAATSARVDRFITLSHFVAARIGRYYNRTATIVYPPVDTVFYHPDAAATPASHFLIVSALVPYKRIELAIEACRRAGASLRIVGDGPDRSRLERLAGADVTFLGWLTDEEVREEYRRAAAVLLPGEEDFGIVPLEAQACGRPVVARACGGALETVLDDDTGILVANGNAESWADALTRCRARTFDPARLRAHAERFSREHCVARMKAVIAETVEAPSGQRW